MNLMRSMPGVSWMRASRSDSRARAAVAQVVLVAVDRLAQQRDFLAAFPGELAHLGGDLLGMPALLGAAHARHDAVGAKLVAADHDADIRLERRRPHRRIAHRIVAFEAAFDLGPRLGAVEADGQLRLRRLLRPLESAPATARAGRGRKRCRRYGARLRISS